MSLLHHAFNFIFWFSIVVQILYCEYCEPTPGDWCFSALQYSYRVTNLVIKFTALCYVFLLCAVCCTYRSYEHEPWAYDPDYFDDPALSGNCGDHKCSICYPSGLSGMVSAVHGGQSRDDGTPQSDV